MKDLIKYGASGIIALTILFIGVGMVSGFLGDALGSTKSTSNETIIDSSASQDSFEDGDYTNDPHWNFSQSPTGESRINVVQLPKFKVPKIDGDLAVEMGDNSTGDKIGLETHFQGTFENDSKIVLFFSVAQPTGQDTTGLAQIQFIGESGSSLSFKIDPDTGGGDGQAYFENSGNCKSFQRKGNPVHNEVYRLELDRINNSYANAVFYENKTDQVAYNYSEITTCFDDLKTIQLNKEDETIVYYDYVGVRSVDENSEWETLETFQQIREVVNYNASEINPILYLLFIGYLIIFGYLFYGIARNLKD